MLPVILKAYGITGHQLSGTELLGSALYDIGAKLPPGTTDERFRAMLQNLLRERFKLEVRHELRGSDAYALVVGRNGSKLREGSKVAEPLPSEPIHVPADDFADLPAGHPRMLAYGYGTTGSAYIVARLQTTSELATQLVQFVGRPVVDKTSLTGAYDFKLKFASILAGRPVPRRDQYGEFIESQQEPSEPIPSLFDALQDQLGLKLESVKMPLDFLVIEHLERKPADN